jgi:hypothetical protein
LVFISSIRVDNILFVIDADGNIEEVDKNDRFTYQELADNRFVLFCPLYPNQGGETCNAKWLRTPTKALQEVQIGKPFKIKHDLSFGYGNSFFMCEKDFNSKGYRIFSLDTKKGSGIFEWYNQLTYIAHLAQNKCISPSTIVLYQNDNYEIKLFKPREDEGLIQFVEPAVMAIAVIGDQAVGSFCNISLSQIWEDVTPETLRLILLTDSDLYSHTNKLQQVICSRGEELLAAFFDPDFEVCGIKIELKAEKARALLTHLFVDLVVEQEKTVEVLSRFLTDLNIRNHLFDVPLALIRLLVSSKSKALAEKYFRIMKLEDEPVLVSERDDRFVSEVLTMMLADPETLKDEVKKNNLRLAVANENRMYYCYKALERLAS